MLRPLLFALLLLPLLVVTSSVRGAEPEQESTAVLARFVGNWQTEITDKVEGGPKKVEQEVCEFALGKKFVLGRQLSDGGASLGLTLITYDPTQKNYPHWFFTTSGNVERLTGHWDAAKQSMSASLTEEGAIVTTSSRFLDRDSIESVVRAVDADGNLVAELSGKQTRQPAEKTQNVLAKWERVTEEYEFESETAALTLQRLVGTWEVTRTYRPSEWFPREVVTKSQVTRSWALNKRYLLEQSRHSNGSEDLSLLTFEGEDYLSYWFDSAGRNVAAQGLYPVISGLPKFIAEFPGQLPPAMSATAGLSFPDDDHYVWKVTIKDDDGQKIFDGEWSGVRKRG